MSSAAATLSPPTRRDDVRHIGMISLAHGASHFSQLLLPPLFPWLKAELNASYAELGVLLTVFYVVSCIVQALSGFWVDRFGPRPVMLAGLGLLALSTLGLALSPGYAAMLVCIGLAGVGNGVFHPVDYTVLNRKVSQPRLGHAYSAHGISGNLGWAAAPALMVPVALATTWRHALALASALIFIVLLLTWARRRHLDVPALDAAARDARADAGLSFLRIPAVWMCFTFFLLFAMVLSGVQTFAPEAARQLHGMPAAWLATCLTAYMVCAAGGMVAGGFLAANPERCEKVIAVGLGLAASIALTIGYAQLPAWAVPALFAAMGAVSGMASPSRDMLVKRSTPAQSSGRVYGVVYSGLDIGQAVAPLLFGVLLDTGRPQAIWAGIAALQALLVVSAFRVQRVRRTPLGLSHSSTGS